MRKLLSFTFLFLSLLCANAQNKNYWTPVNEADVSKGKDLFANHFKPAAYKLFQLQETLLRADLFAVPSEKSVTAAKSGSTISVPNPDGQIESFRIVEAPIMEAGLAAKYPSIKSYVGQGINNPSSTIRFDITPSGFHAMVTSVNRPTFYVNPLDKATQTYAVNARNQNDPVNQFTCEVEASMTGGIGDGKTNIKDNADDGKLRQYRLALSVNGEYSQYFLDGTEADTAAMKAKVMDDLVACLVRANEVYERDFGIRMVFFNNEDTLIFLDPATDPYSKNSGDWNTAIQNTCKTYVGNDNFDIGHVIIKVAKISLNNGNAGCIGCVCSNSTAPNRYKGSGFTAYYDPSLLDYEVIDYWTHEMGHQFGSNHTFTFSTEGTQAQIEPGSGSTIMGYAGITGATDVQPHSDDLFATVSISQNASYMKSQTQGGACAVVTETSNQTPTVDAGADYTIPKSTAFVLTGVAADADKTDNLSSVWEQIDVGTSSTTYPKTSATKGPAFRTFNYIAAPVRYFPELSTTLKGLVNTKWEALPAVARDLNFRFTARDNHPGGGNNNSDDMVVTVDAASGPFVVTTQNTTPAEWFGGDNQTITWDVANTDAAPVNCSNVNILLSTDGGDSFSIVLAANTPNDGSEEITVPSVNTDNARIKIEAVGNIFFDISNTDFSVKSALPVTWLSFTAQRLNNTAAVLLNWSTVTEQSNNYFEVERSADGASFTQLSKVTAGNHPGQAQSYTYSDYKAIAGANYYRLKQVDADGYSSYSAIAKVMLPTDGITWSVQPNPATNAAVLLARKELNNVHIQLTNASGKVVYKLQQLRISAGQQITIPVNNLPKGMYILNLSSNENNKSEKLIVQ
ncbi:MAG TPA: zinc-dependent metalloprotease family protein [Panacibacter sp.]|nr:zinc-dependent metalloprotease family protein [Panacibacter sp.]